MNRYLLRLLGAFTISAACFGGTVYWYQKTSRASLRTNKEDPVALLKDHKNDVQRKPLGRVIWESITKNENLFAGEEVRTTSVSEAQILFLQTGTTIELEPESLIVLEKNENGIALNFLKGNLFVKNDKGGSASPGQALTLKSGNSQIDLKSADISLTKTNQGEIDLEVLRGKAQLQQNGKTLMLDKTKSGILTDQGVAADQLRIHTLEPRPGEPVYVPADKQPYVIFKWNKLPRGYNVQLKAGPSRTQLKPIPSATAPGEKGELKAPFKVGKFYWQLVALSSQPDKPQRESRTLPSSVIALKPPVLLEPENKSKVVLDQENQEVRFKWVNPAQLTDLVLEVAKDKNLKQPLFSGPIQDHLGFKILKLTQTGNYFFRITGFMPLKGKPHPVSSPIHTFHLKAQADLVPPVLRSPIAEQEFTFEQVRDLGVLLTWDILPGISKYQVNVEQVSKKKKKSISKQVPRPPFRIETLKPGHYKWSVRSINGKGQLSAPSEARQFKVQNLPEIQWAEGAQDSEYFYNTAKPSLFVSWLKGNKDIHNWRLYLKENKNSAKKRRIRISESQATVTLSNDGTYLVQVEGLDTQENVIARSRTKKIFVGAQPLLPAPQLADHHPQTLQSTKRGDLNLQWRPVPGANRYILSIKKPDGSTYMEKTIDRTMASLKDLRPGQYKVILQSIDQFDRTGSEQTTRALEVPEKSNIQAPKVRDIKVK